MLTFLLVNLGITPVKVNRELADGLPDSQFVVYENSGHLAALEEKTKFGRDAREFIERLKL